jgi:hypothetical protein
VPAPAKTPEVDDVEVFLRAMVRAVDSSLVDEWERIRSPGEARLEAPAAAPDAPGEADVTRDERALLVLVRNAMFKLLGALARRDWAAAAERVAAGAEPAWTGDDFQRALGPFFEEHTGLRLDPSARAPTNTRVTKEAERGIWEVVQVVPDAEGDDDWALTCYVDLAASAQAGHPVVVMRGAGR